MASTPPRRPTLREIMEMLETVVRRSDEALAIPRLPRRARQRIEELRAEVEELLRRDGRR